jgi:hypothetical protein
MFAGGHRATAPRTFFVSKLELLDEGLGDGAFVTGTHFDEDATDLAALRFLLVESGP